MMARIKYLFLLYSVCLESITLLCSCSDVSRFSTYANENEALKEIDTVLSSTGVDKIAYQKDVQFSMERGWWNLTRALILASHNQGIDVAVTVRQVSTDIRNHLDELIRLLDKQHNNIAVVAPAFQWAQSPRHIFLNIKFAYRWSSPGALSVDDSHFDSKERFFYFEGLGKHSGAQKRYELSLNLLKDIIPEKTTWNFASVGKVVVTLFKKDLSVWNRLTQETTKIANMNVWWDMKEKMQEDMDAFEIGNYTETFNSEKQNQSLLNSESPQDEL